MQVWLCRCSKSRCGVCKPTISICGRFTAWLLKMTLTSSFGQMERRRRCQSKEGWQDPICGIHRTPEPDGAFGNVEYGISIRFCSNAAERIRSWLYQEFRKTGPAGTESSRHCRPWHETSKRPWRANQGRCTYG